MKEKKSANKICYDHDTTRAIISPQVKQLKLATAVVKGGVGKTTIAEALAIRAALYGIRVLCVDIDQQANLTKGLSMDEAAMQCPIMADLIEGKATAEEAVLNVIPGLDLIPSRLDNVTLDGYMMVNRLNPSFIFDKLLGDVFKRYDLIIFDCPPTLGLTVCSAMLCADFVMAPLNPDVYSYEGIEIMEKEIENIYQQFNKKVALKILLNKFDTKTLLSKNYGKKLLEDPRYSSKLLNSVIKVSQDFPNMKNKGKSIFDSLKKNTAKQDIDELTQEIIAMMSLEQNSNASEVITEEAAIA